MGQSRVPREASASVCRRRVDFCFFFRASHHRTTRENARGSVSSSISRSRGSLERVEEITSRKVRGLARRARGRVAGAREAQARVRPQSRLERWHAVVVRARVAFPGPSLAPWREKRNAFLSRNKPSGDTRRVFGGARAYLEPLGQTQTLVQRGFLSEPLRARLQTHAKPFG